MSENKVKTVQKKSFSPVLKWTSAIFAIAILEVCTIFASVKISEYKYFEDKNTVKSIEKNIAAQNDKMQQLSDSTAENNRNYNVVMNNFRTLENRFNNLYNEVGDNKIQALDSKVQNFNQRLELIEEKKNEEALILSLALIIKENALYHRSFATEADILTTLSQEQDQISDSVRVINSMKEALIPSDIALQKNFHEVLAQFEFFKENNDSETTEGNSKKNAMSKHIEMIKDTVAGINFDKIIVIKKDKATPKEKQLLATLTKFVDDNDFKSALDFIRNNGEFAQANNQQLNKWVVDVEQKLAFDTAISDILAKELSEIRKSFANSEVTQASEVVE